jgi:aryl-alcohol dehydrogenase-like predicted oxidoreductase
VQYRHLGTSGLKVSCLGLGTHMNLGHSLDETQSREMLRAAYEGGVNLIDTADAYSGGAAEEMLGVCLPDLPRSDMVILTKVAGATGDGPNDRGLSAKHIREACDSSLKRLGIDYIDVYLCHQIDKTTPIEETVRAMTGVVRAGKALYWGVSNWTPAMVVRANAIARELGAPTITACQDRYNLLYRKPESELFPTFEQESIGCVAFSPLAHGMLAGVYKPGETAPPAGSRAAVDPTNPVTRMYYNEEYKVKTQELIRIAGEMGTSAPVLATAWCLTHPQVSSTLVGAWKVSELQQNLAAGDLVIPEDARARLDALYPPPEAP